MLRYQQQFQFFDPALVSGPIRFVNLSDALLETDLSAVLDKIVKEVEAVSPAIVIVDSFRTLLRKLDGAQDSLELQTFLQRLALHLAGWQATTFLLGERSEEHTSELQSRL